MISLYVFSLVLGGALLVVSALGGGDHGHSDGDLHIGDADVDGHVDLDSGGDLHADFGADADADFDAHADFDADADVGDADADAHLDHSHDLSKDLQKELDKGFEGANLLTLLLSMRFWTFFLAFFGASGLTVTLLSWASTVPTAIFAAITGTVCGGLGAGIVRWLQNDEVRSAIDPRDWVGRNGEVSIRCAPGKTGKVSVAFEDHLQEVLAVSDDGELQPGTKVLIVEMRDGVAQVTPVAPGGSKKEQLLRAKQSAKT